MAKKVAGKNAVEVGKMGLLLKAAEEGGYIPIATAVDAHTAIVAGDHIEITAEQGTGLRPPKTR